MTPSLQTDNRVLPHVSVIIPTYNRKDSLLRTLDSLSRQTYPAECFEVIVVDDGGCDGTEVVARRRNRDARLFALRDAWTGRTGKMPDDVAAICYPRREA